MALRYPSSTNTSMGCPSNKRHVYRALVRTDKRQLLRDSLPFIQVQGPPRSHNMQHEVRDSKGATHSKSECTLCSNECRTPQTLADEPEDTSGLVAPCFSLRCLFLPRLHGSFRLDHQFAFPSTLISQSNSVLLQAPQLPQPSS